MVSSFFVCRNKSHTFDRLYASLNTCMEYVSNLVVERKLFRNILK